jgi:predicted SAM-dependent methyltransferase
MFRVIINSLPLSFRDKYRATYHYLKMEISIVVGKLCRLFHRPARPNNLDGSINLHLGCGSIDHPAFINIDGIPAPHIHYVGKIDKLSQFLDDSVDLVYACHCLEHFSHRQVLNVLKEWRRVLKMGGILRLSVPDFNSMVELYLAAGRDIQYVLAPLTGGQDYKYNFHKTIFNEEFLSRLFFEAGFVQVQRWAPGSSEMTTFDDWSGRVIPFNDRAFPISLNLEAVK